MKKSVIVVIVIVVIILLILGCLFFIKPNDNKTVYTNASGEVIQIEDEESVEDRVVKEMESYEVNSPDFLDRSGFKVVKSDLLANVKFETIYSQEKDRAQLDLNFDGGRKATLTVDKSDLHVVTEEERPDVLLISGLEVTFLVGDDNLRNYYYQKDNMYYAFRTYDDFTNEELFNIVDGFNTELGDNF